MKTKRKLRPFIELYSYTLWPYKTPTQADIEISLLLYSNYIEPKNRNGEL